MKKIRSADKDLSPPHMIATGIMIVNIDTKNAITLLGSTFRR
jgi:hypothetical protein